MCATEAPKKEMTTSIDRGAATRAGDGLEVEQNGVEMWRMNVPKQSGIRQIN
jgi:hypothetical protein